jgi:midasin (ATPase involved in ribosome maturation)
MNELKELETQLFINHHYLSRTYKHMNRIASITTKSVSSLCSKSSRSVLRGIYSRLKYIANNYDLI